MAMYEVEKEAIWLSYLLAELRFQKWSFLVTLYADNKGLIALSNNFQFHRCTKIIDVWFHLICEAVFLKLLQIIYIPKAKMAANSQTKRLPFPAFSDFRCIINV